MTATDPRLPELETIRSRLVALLTPEERDTYGDVPIHLGDLIFDLGGPGFPADTEAGK